MYYKSEPGISVYQATLNAILHCHEKDKANVQFYHNDILLTVSRESNPVDICEIYSLKCDLHRLNKS